MTSSPSIAVPAPLRMQRMSLAQLRASIGPDSSKPLAALAYGRASNEFWLTDVSTPTLLDDELRVDVWQAGTPVQSDSTGVVRWRSDGHWLIGIIDLDDADEDVGLERLAQRAYADVFRTLDQTGFRQLQRVWNYLPRINADGGGMERYRQFNVGRQRAFLDAGQAAFEGAPAACALGLPHRKGGGLSVRFLAGHVQPVPVENPRQVSAYRYPERYGPRAPTFSRAALTAIGDGETALFVSGTASIVGHETVHAGNLNAQVSETLDNLRTVIAEASKRVSTSFTLEDTTPVVYVRHPSDAAAVRAQLAAEVGAASRFMREAVFLEADICRADLLMEIETHGTVRASLIAP